MLTDTFFCGKSGGVWRTQSGAALRERGKNVWSSETIMPASSDLTHLRAQDNARGHSFACLESTRTNMLSRATARQALGHLRGRASELSRATAKETRRTKEPKEMDRVFKT